MKFNFPDAWYHLHNATPPLLQMEPAEIEIPVTPTDFPANQSDIRIERVSLLLLQEDANVPDINVFLKFTPESGTSAMDGGMVKTKEALISRQNGNADDWDVFIGSPPFGKWRLKLRDGDNAASYTTVEQLLVQKRIKDLLFVVTFSGTRSSWNA